MNGGVESGRTSMMVADLRDDALACVYNPAMAIVGIDSLDDERIAAYRMLKDRELAREGDRFIAEGAFVVQRLLASDFPVESVLVAQRRCEEIAPLVRSDAPIYIVSNQLIHDVIGYRFHSGVIACGRRKKSLSVEEVLKENPLRSSGLSSKQPRTGNSSLSKQSGNVTLVILPETSNSENLGAMIRISSAFGAAAMILGPKCCDPFWRQAIRVSMGTVFNLPIVRSHDLMRDLERLAVQDVQLWATVLDEGADNLADLRRPTRLGLLFGNEAQGLSENILSHCHRRVTIPMQLGTDSLNVSVSAGIFLYALSRP
jgi:tRNA G18 (ribose-2'-O)-methylase SpoU